MTDSDAGHPIRPPESIRQSSDHETSAAPSFPEEDTHGPGGHHQRTVPAGMVFGALVGLPMGAVVGAAICWLAGLFDSFWLGVLIGSLTGPIGGLLIGLKERKARGDFVRPDLATIICVVYGLFPALLILLLGFGGVTRTRSAFALVGMAFVGPTIGLLIGGTLDRAFEASLQRSWGTALSFGIAGVTACGGMVFLMDSLAYGPDPKEIARESRGLIYSEWKKNPEMREATIQNLSLVRSGRRTYRGWVDATIDGETERLDLDVRVEGDLLSLKLTPRNE